MKNLAGVICLCCALGGMSIRADEPDWQHGTVDSDGVKIHYVTAGKGPLVVMVHGFPDYWYTWRRQIPELSKHFQVVAIDQRGYNRSDQPDGVESYGMQVLANDVRHVIDHFQAEKAVIVGHDWGGYVAWTVAMMYPQRVDRLVVLNAPHPACLQRELAGNPAQQQGSAYAREFQKADSASKLDASQLAGWVTDPDARKEYVAAFERSSFESMMNYYKANYPRPADSAEGEPKRPMFPKVQCRVLMIHGLEDSALLPAGLNGSWEWIDRELTIVTVPGAGHFVQQDAPQRVTRRIVEWLTAGN